MQLLRPDGTPVSPVFAPLWPPPQEAGPTTARFGTAATTARFGAGPLPAGSPSAGGRSARASVAELLEEKDGSRVSPRRTSPRRPRTGSLQPSSLDAAGDRAFSPLGQEKAAAGHAISDLYELLAAESEQRAKGNLRLERDLKERCTVEDVAKLQGEFRRQLVSLADVISEKLSTVEGSMEGMAARISDSLLVQQELRQATADATQVALNCEQRCARWEQRLQQELRAELGREDWPQLVELRGRMEVLRQDLSERAAADRAESQRRHVELAERVRELTSCWTRVKFTMQDACEDYRGRSPAPDPDAWGPEGLPNLSFAAAKGSGERTGTSPLPGRGRAVTSRGGSPTRGPTGRAAWPEYAGRLDALLQAGEQARALQRPGEPLSLLGRSVWEPQLRGASWTALGPPAMSGW